MDFRVILLCVVAAYGKTSEYSYYKPNSGLSSRDARGQPSNVKEGFVQPLDFTSFSQQFEKEDQSGGASFGRAKPPLTFSADNSKSGAFQAPNPEFPQFPGPVFPAENKTNNQGFVQPLQFVSSFEKGSNSPKLYKTNITPATVSKPELPTNDQITKSTESLGEGEDPEAYYNPSKVPSYRHPRRPQKPKKPYTYGKSSYPGPQKKSKPSEYYYPGLLPESKDVEMILPKDKVLFLPMVNGKPKPYDGYRAAPEAEEYESFDSDETKESSEQRERRLNEGEIIYGRPKIPLSELHHRQLKRSPAEYYGGIYPYYDYSDAKLSVSGDTDRDANRGKKSSATNEKRKKVYPKKHIQENREKTCNPYKYPKENAKKRNKEDDTSGESSEEVEDESDEETEETKGGKPLYKYTYDNTFSIPQLEIKTYPYEKKARDSRVEGSRRDENFELDDNVDEYTAGYERYIKTLPSDLETYFGSPDTERYTVEATQNLEKNPNCKKIESAPEKTEEGGEKAKAEADGQTQVCYVCSDPKTGDNYEQCAYRNTPKAQKYYFGGTTSFQSNETAEPTTYRYKRATYDDDYSLDPYASEESESKESKESSEEFFKKPKKKSKKSKKYKKPKTSGSTLFGKKHPKKRYQAHREKEYDPFFSLYEEATNKRAVKLEEPPKSYDGPKYTYEGPEDTYEGPSQTYEGPKVIYEGPAEPYEGPINQEYYDNSDERIEESEEEESSSQESQTPAPERKSKYYDDEEPTQQRPKKRQSYSSKYERPYAPSKYSDGEFQESYRPRGRYTSDYRFGPEHFVDEEEPEGSKTKEQVKQKPTTKTSEKRGPQKFSTPESRSAAASDKQEKEEPIGEVKVFKNGDVCQKKRKEGMICMVCKNEKTAATYEQCQYSTKPKDKYYAYGSQKSYTTKNPAAQPKEQEDGEPESESDQFPEKSDIVEKKILITTQSKVFGYDPVPTEGLAVAESNNSPFLLSKDLYADYSDNIETLNEEQNQNDTDSRDFTESIERIEPRDGIEGLEEYLYDAEDNEKKASEDEKQSYKSYDDYFHDLFPDFAKGGDAVPYSDEKEESESEKHLTFDPFSNVRKFHEENAEPPARYSKNAEDEEEEEEKDAEASRPEELRLKDKESRIPADFFLPYNEESHKKDLEKALGEFQNKDWSNCKKIVKKKLTCYQCVDKNGVNNEECMYVEASQPINKHLAYHEKKELKPSEQNAKNKTNEPLKEATQPEKEKSLRRFRKDKNSPEDLIEVPEPSKDTEYVDNTTSKGDFEGIQKLPITETTTKLDTTTEETTGQQVTEKTNPKKQKRHPKKRNKTIRNETTTERFEKVRKRKFPLKKFSVESEEPLKASKSEDEAFDKNEQDVEKREETTTATTTTTTTTENSSS